MRAAKIAVGILAGVTFLAGVALYLGTCFGGTTLADAEMARAASGAWQARLGGVELPVGATVVVDTWCDYSGEGTIAFTANARSASGLDIPLGAETRDDEGGSTWGSFERVGRFVPADRGPWTVDVEARGVGGIEIDRASAVIRTGVMDSQTPAFLALTGGLLLAVVASRIPTRRG